MAHRYDLIVSGGRVIDSSQGIDDVRDVALSDGKVALVAEYITAEQARDAIDAAGTIVTPGLIDLHTHDFWGASHYGVAPDTVHIAKGVTTVVDAGSAGALTFPAFRRYVIDRAQTRIYAMLNISAMGMVLGYAGLEDTRWANVEEAVRVGREHRDIVLGVKARIPPLPTQSYRGVLRRAIEAAEGMDGIFMLHLGGTSIPVAERLNVLRPGDVLTHSFRHSPGGNGILDSEGKVLEEAWTAKERGGVFDVGHGKASFSFETMEHAMAQGFFPDTISSDLHIGNVDRTVYDLLTTLSKFLQLGMTLDEVIRLGTEAPSRVIGKSEELGTLRPGAVGDVTISKLEEGRFELSDSGGRRIVEATHRLTHVQTIKGGRVYRPYLA
ncbi:MAG: amidohydrolase/deacetylase family metallohydrolase [Chloroflexi bacterium]|nr:amidohydrolase/deacetylase family metallohydrolase [Chloroflexota bacterium]